MMTVLLVIHLLISVALVGIVLLQKSEGGGLGMGGGNSGGMGGFMTGRATANLLTRTTAVLAAAFMLSSLTLAIIGNQGKTHRSILDTPIEKTAPNSPANGAAKAPAKPVGPTVPLAK